MDNFENLKVKELKEILKAKKLPIYGTKADLLKRLRDNVRPEDTNSSSSDDVLTVESEAAADLFKSGDESEIVEPGFMSTPKKKRFVEVSLDDMSDIDYEVENRFIDGMEAMNAEALIESLRQEDSLFEKSSRDDDESEDYLLNIKKSRGRGVAYDLVDEFEHEKDAFEIIEAEKTWQNSRTTFTIEGRKQEFRCRYRTIGCRAALYVLRSVSSFKLYKYGDHENHLEVELGIRMPIREKIIELHNNGTKKPKSIRVELRKFFPTEVPSKKQLENFLYN